MLASKLNLFSRWLTCMCVSANLYNFASVTWVPMLNTTRGTEKPPGTIQLLRALNMLYLEWWETISNTFFLCTCSCKQESFTTGALGRSCYMLLTAPFYNPNGRQMPEPAVWINLTIPKHHANFIQTCWLPLWAPVWVKTDMVYLQVSLLSPHTVYEPWQCLGIGVQVWVGTHQTGGYFIYHSLQ